MIGPLLVIGAIALLWWNEGRAVQAIVGLKDAASQVVEAEASGPSPANDNKLVHVVGAATAQIVGFAIFLAPLSTLASVIPILGDLVGGAVTLVSVAIGVPLSILVIAFAWLTFRPLIGGGLILVALVVGYLLWRWRNPARQRYQPAHRQSKASGRQVAEAEMSRNRRPRQRCPHR